MCAITFYIGKDDSPGTADVGMTQAVVMRLVDPNKGRGHHVYMDNYYTSPQLFSDLCDIGFGVCGKVQVNRRGLPAAMKESVRKGETKGIQLDNSMLAIKWMDKCAVTALTTIHEEAAVAVERHRCAPGGRETVMKSQAMVEYKWYMGGGTMLTSCCPTMALGIAQ